MVQSSTFESQIKSYKLKQNACVKLIQVVSDLWFNQSIELVLFRNQLIDRRVSFILNLHQKTKELAEKEISIDETLQIAEIIQGLELTPSRIDIGKLALEVRKQSIQSEDLFEFISKELAPAHQHETFEPRDVILYGFGRIGRLLARELISKAGGGRQLRLRAIVTRDQLDAKTLEKRASLLRQDSIHGDFEGQVEVDVEKGALIVNGVPVYIISAKTPEEIDYSQYDIKEALVIDNTGAFRDRDELSRHLSSKGVSQVLLTAPGKGVPNIVYGVNEFDADRKKDNIFSAASCTTNAIAPVLAVLQKRIGIVKGHIETIHSYTNDQNLVDNFHKKERRGRAAALNMVITETGAGTAVAKVLPSLAGKLTSNAIRVPVPNGSLAILNLELSSITTVEEINGLLKKAALEGELVEQIQYSNNKELVSSDIVGTTAASVVDTPATIVSPDGKNVVIYVWYDNEYGYTHQVMRLARHIAGVKRYCYY
ncbi:glyceraldehyde-3-phosphate dehydrogenase [Sphingobacterium sp. DK4209]|uniref:Glyceraldehyde-3-phosphate dehydrogenase n=1 Tax=Sphingobacterium zhuxiongii TaxID=2662364 RepID=A0A5Q0QDC4_9SPHI|nr:MULTISPECIES: glyceraldehyde-3-phosphate dehydrogenase [unclassified Sphingobacterium]MVZ66511.1 glyceraldehyde-3-phosphate dehydrogenase [Sphingobacterium sp. DK4209]QGA27835.1 glyceraldehyde-3-phosphate dehydrogenase [Sphingobacterium sp. dk4302]